MGCNCVTPKPNEETELNPERLKQLSTHSLSNIFI